MKLNNLLMLKRVLKKPVVVLKICINNQVLILKCQLLVLKMMRTHIRNLHILGLWIIIHGRPSMRHLMKVTLSRLNYLPEHLSIYVRSIKISHKKFQMILIIIFK